MSLRLKPSKSLSGLSSTAIKKHLNARKDISEAAPRIWREKDEPIELNDLGQVVLKLNHPLLRAVDSCKSLRDIDRVISQLVVSGIFQNSLTASRVVKKLSSDRRTLSRAVHVLRRIEKPDALLCNLVMRGFVDSNDSDSALRFFHEECVAEKFVAPNHFTFPILVKACTEIGNVREGKKAHSRVVKSGFGSDSFVRNSLIRMYSVCGSVEEAREVFDEMLDWDLVSWNLMIHVYVKNGDMGDARKLFEEMPERDLFTWNTLISGYVETGFMKAAKLLFDLMPEKDIVTWNIMIDGYARTVNIIDAVKTFEKCPRPRSATSWNTILALFVRIKDYNECLVFFDKMLESQEVKPNGATLVSVLNACSNFSRLDKGKWVHSYIESNKIKLDTLLSTSLLTMYAKCGEIETARRVFDEMIPEKTVVSWNSMIVGYGIHGNGEKALEMFFEMEEKGFLPNEATFVCVLSACAHSGMVLEGWRFFDLMKRRYTIEPRVEHYGCMVDILSRAGMVKDSEELIKVMPMEAGPAVWGSLLRACGAESNSRLGEIVAKRLIQTRPQDIGPYVMLSNVYATQGKWDRVEEVRKVLRDNCLHKEEGKSAAVVYSMLNEMGSQLKLGNWT